MVMKLVDMRKTPEDKAEDLGLPGSVNEYPYGLAIRLTDSEIERLQVDHAEWGVGDIFDLRAMARVTSISKNETADGERCSIEMQIIMLGAESEDDEELPRKKIGPKSLYGK